MATRSHDDLQGGKEMHPIKMRLQCNAELKTHTVRCFDLAGLCQSLNSFVTDKDPRG